MMSDQVLARLAALKTTPTPKLKEQWRQLFDSEPPPFNRQYIESRLAYRIQELAYGGLKPETVRRLEKLGEELDGGRISVRSTTWGMPGQNRPRLRPTTKSMLPCSCSPTAWVTSTGRRITSDSIRVPGPALVTTRSAAASTTWCCRCRRWSSWRC